MRALILVALLSAGCRPRAAPAPAVAAPDPSAPPVEITLAKLGEACQQDPAAAASRYAGRRLAFRGAAMGLSKRGDALVIALHAPPYVATCPLRPAFAAAAEGLNSDKVEEVKMVCTFAARERSVLAFRDCELYRKQDLPPQE